MSFNSRRMGVLVSLPALAALLVGLWLFRRFDDSQQLLQQAESALLHHRNSVAEQLARRVLAKHPASSKALYIAGKAAAALDRPGDALAYWDRLKEEQSAEAVASRCAAGDLLLTTLHHVSDAERQFRKAIRQNPDSLPASEGSA